MTPATSAPERLDLATELARRVDWRQAVEALGLGDREARELCIAVMRRRCFGDGRRLRVARRPGGRT